MIDRLLNLSDIQGCEILWGGCAFFPDASIHKQLGMIALPVGDRSVGNERAGFRSPRAFEPIYLMLQRNRIERLTAICAISGVPCPSLWQRKSAFRFHGRARPGNRVDILRLNAGSRPIETMSVNREEFTAITT
jgi:hypothetical protein